MNKTKLKLLTTVTALVLASSSVAHAETGEQKLQALVDSINVIDNRLQLSVSLGIGAVGYAEVGGVITDGSMDDGHISDAMVTAYLDAVDQVMEHDYATATTAEQLFVQEHVAAMNNLALAVDILGEATSVLMTATSVAEIAMEADTAPEQVALQEMLATDEYSIDAQEVAEYNHSIDSVEGYAQQAGAFMAAANNESLTASIDSYATQNNIIIGNYSALTYTQSVDEFVITWDNYGNATGWSGYLTDEMKESDDIYGAATYIMQHGSLANSEG